MHKFRLLVWYSTIQIYISLYCIGKCICSSIRSHVKKIIVLYTHNIHIFIKIFPLFFAKNCSWHHSIKNESIKKTGEPSYLRLPANSVAAAANWRKRFAKGYGASGYREPTLKYCCIPGLHSIYYFFSYIFLWVFVYMYLCHPSEASTRYCVIPGGYPPQDWQSFPCAGEELDLNPRLLICSQVRYHWATSPPKRESLRSP